MISSAFARRSTGLVLVLMASVTGSCEAPPRPAIGVTSSEAYVNAARIAVADFYADSDLPVDTLLRPEASNRAGAALRTAEEFVATPGIVAVVGHSNSAASLAASQIYNAHDVVQIAPTASAALYSEAGPFSFRLVPSDERQGRFLAEVLRDSLASGTRIALMYVNDDYGRGLRASVLKELAALGDSLPIVLDMPHTNGFDTATAGQEHLLEALGASRAEAILWLGRASALHSVLPAIRDRLGGTPIYGSDALASAIHVRTGDGRWNGVRYVALADLDATAEGRRFKAAYQERFGTPPGGPAGLTHDAVGLLLSALREARTGPEIREYLVSLGRDRPPYPGVTGPIQFDERGDVNRPYHLATLPRGPAP